MCGCHDPGVFGHKPPCPWAPPKPSLILVDKATGQGSVLIRTGAQYD